MRLFRSHTLRLAAVDPASARATAAELEKDKAEVARRDTAALLDHARWLLDYHSRRADGAQQRALGVIAFSGALLALAPRTVSQGGNHLTWVKAVYVVATALIILTIGLALGALAPQTTQAPSIGALRKHWHEHLFPHGARRQGRDRDVAETLLLGTDLTRRSPLDFAKDEADSRVRRLRYAYFALTPAIICFGVLGAQLVITNGGAP